MGGAGKRGGQDMVTVSVGGVERLEGVEMGGGVAVLVDASYLMADELCERMEPVYIDASCCKEKG